MIVHSCDTQQFIFVISDFHNFFHRAVGLME